MRRLAVQCFRRESDQDFADLTFNIINDYLSQMGSSDGIEETEEWCQDQLGDEKDELWHTQMAKVYRQMKRERLAEERCDEALELDKDNWRALLLQAKLIQPAKSAIHQLEKLTKRFEEDKKLQRDYPEAFADIAYNLGDRYWDENKTKNAIRSYTQSVRWDPSASQHIYNIICKYSGAGRWDQIVALLDQVRKQEKAPIPALMVAMRGQPDFHAVLLQAWINTESLYIDDIKAFYEEAVLSIKDGDHETSFLLRNYYANALSALRPVIPTEKVGEILEVAVKDLPQTSFPIVDAFFFVGYRLGTVYLAKAQEAKAAGKLDAVERWLNKLVEIVPEQLNEDQMSLPPRLFAARYHVTNKDLVSAQASAHRTLRVAVELLSDNEPGNDFLAYEKILYAVIPFGDKKNATAALAMMFLEGKFEQKCSCGCGEDWLTPGNMFWCMDCINVALKPDCYKKVKDRATVTRVCDENHEHLEIPERDEENMDVDEGQVPYNGKAITMELWSNKLSEKYDLGMSRRLHALRH